MRGNDEPRKRSQGKEVGKEGNLGFPPWCNLPPKALSFAPAQMTTPGAFTAARRLGAADARPITPYTGFRCRCSIGRHIAKLPKGSLGWPAVLLTPASVSAGCWCLGLSWPRRAGREEVSVCYPLRAVTSDNFSIADRAIRPIDCEAAPQHRLAADLCSHFHERFP